MANYDIKDGGDLMLFIGTGESKTTLAFATSHKLSVQAETVENTNKDNASGKWVSKTAKKMSWSVTSENLFIEKGDTAKKQNAYGDLFDLMVKREAIDVVFAGASEAAGDEAQSIPSGGWTAETTGTYEGKVLITSLECNAPAGDNATYSITMEGVGELKHTPLA